MAGLWTWGIDFKGQPLLDAWWTPGWTSQNRNIDSVQVPVNQFVAPGFPAGLTYVNIVGNYFDTSSDPLSGYLTFWPSSPLTFTVNNVVTYMPQRYAGVNQTLLGLNQMGDGKIYLWYGQLSVTLLATDNANMLPVNFTYHVKEHYKGGLQYDISVPSADSSSAIDIHNLIIPGTICSVNDEEPESEQDFIRVAVTSSQWIAADITEMLSGIGNLTNFPVSLAFISGPAQPQPNQWIPASWNSNQAPYIAQLLVGPNGYVLSQGTYKVWARIVGPGGLEPVIPVGYVEIY